MFLPSRRPSPLSLASSGPSLLAGSDAFVAVCWLSLHADDTVQCAAVQCIPVVFNFSPLHLDLEHLCLLRIKRPIVFYLHRTVIGKKTTLTCAIFITSLVRDV